MFAGLVSGEIAKSGDPQAKEAAGGVMGMIAGLGAIFGICMLVFAAIYILAGYGVVNRKQYGRIITLILGALAGISALLNLISITKNPGGAILGAAINGGYCAFVYIVLLNRQNAAEFS